MTREALVGEQRWPRTREGRQAFASYLKALPNDEKLEFKKKAENCTFFMAREVLWMTTSDIEVLDENGTPVAGDIKEGPEWGISPEGPHKEIVACLDRPTLLKHIESPRGSYKSSILTAFCVRHICKDPNIRIFYSMAKKDEGVKKSLAIRAWFEGDPVIDLIWGSKKVHRKDEHQRCVGDKWKEDMWTVSMRNQVWPDPTFQVGAIDLERTGIHCNILITDDVVVTKHYETPDGPKKVQRYWEELQPFPVTGGMWVDIGTRKADHDLHSQKLEEPMRSSWDVVVLTCGMQLVQNDAGVPELVGESIWPFMGEDWLRRKMAGYGGNVAAFVRDYMNECLPSGIQMFSAKDIQYVPWEPWMAGCHGYMFTDFATADENNDGCFSVIAVGLMDQARRFYLLDCWISRGQPDIVASTVVEKWMYWNQYISIQQMMVENVTQYQAYAPSIMDLCRQRQIHIPVVRISRKMGVTQKKARIQRQQPRWKQKRFFIVDSPWKERVWHYDDLGLKVLFDPTGTSIDRSKPGMPDGEFVRQFTRHGVYNADDIPDALSDMDAVDEDGHPLCPGSGFRSTMNRLYSMNEPGKAFKTVMRNGQQEMVEVSQVRDTRGGDYSLADMFGVR